MLICLPFWGGPLQFKLLLEEKEQKLLSLEGDQPLSDDENDADSREAHFHPQTKH